MSFRTTSLIIILAAQTAFALTPPTRPADPRPIDQLVPSGTPTTVFASVKRAFQLYGGVITASPKYVRLLPLIAQGFPDPAKDLDEVGACTDLTSHQNINVGLVVTGRIDRARALACAAANGVTFTTSVYRGVELLTGKISERSFQIAFFDERVTVISVDSVATHPVMHTMLDNILTAATPHDSTLATGYLLNAAQSLKEFAAGASGPWGFLSHISTVSIDAQPVEATLNVASKIIILTDSPEFATQFSQEIQQAANHQHQHIADPVVSVDGKNVHFNCTVLKSAIEGYLGN